MFEISFPEFALVCIIALLVLGPERLPEALRTLGLWLGRMRRSFNAVRSEIEREIGMDEVRRQLHNETILDDIKRLEREVRSDAAALNRPAVPVAAATSATAGVAAPSAAPDVQGAGPRTEQPNGTAS